jgi:DNA-binding transcriptional LysR family regulator
MDLNRIETFVRVVEAGSFSAAAMRLGQPKSSVSRAISALEQALGVRLLQRTTRKLHLTEAGSAYYDLASRAMTGLDEARAAAQQLQDEPAGLVRVTAAVDIGTWLLAPVLHRFMQRYPAVRVDVMLTPRQVDLVQEGVDLALRAGKLADTALVARGLGALRAGVFAAPAYLAGAGTPKKLADLARYNCLSFRSRSDSETWELIGPAGLERVTVSGSLNADSFEYLRAAVALGNGLGLLPLFTCTGRTDEDLVRVLPSHATAGTPLHLVYPSARFVPKRVALLRDALLAEIPPMLSSG